MTHPKIKEQIGLMELALKINQQIETLENYIKPVDPIIYKVMNETLQASYLDVMQKLFSNLLIISDEHTV